MNLNLLDDVRNIIKRNEDEINKTGKGFNLISILGMEDNERYTHSNIIAELLNAKGSHTFGNKFFELFLEQVGISNFDITDYHVITEEYFPNVKCGDDESMRTFLDIVIKERKTGRVILIENKIWAIDQFEQLERYYECYKDKIVKLFYLNVHQYDYTFSLENLERELNEVEENEMQKIKEVYQSISYETIIKNWLANCIVASSEKPYVSKQIEAYYQTILKISNQNIYKKMSEDIKNKITENLENFETASEIAENFNKICNEISSQFKLKFKQVLPNSMFDSKFGVVKCETGGDDNCDAFYLGIKLIDSETEKTNLANLEFNEIIENLKKCLEINEFWTFDGNKNWNALFYPSTANVISKIKIKELNVEKKLKLFTDIDLEVKNVADEFGAIIEKLKLMLGV